MEDCTNAYNKFIEGLPKWEDRETSDKEATLLGKISELFSRKTKSLTPDSKEEVLQIFKLILTLYNEKSSKTDSIRTLVVQALEKSKNNNIINDANIKNLLSCLISNAIYICNNNINNVEFVQCKVDNRIKNIQYNLPYLNQDDVNILEKYSLDSTNVPKLTKTAISKFLQYYDLLGGSNPFKPTEERVTVGNLKNRVVYKRANDRKKYMKFKGSFVPVTEVRAMPMWKHLKRRPKA